VVATYVHDGDTVRAGQSLFAIDDSVQRATTEQERLQAQGALALLSELKAEPRARPWPWPCRRSTRPRPI